MRDSLLLALLGLLALPLAGCPPRSDDDDSAGDDDDATSDDDDATGDDDDATGDDDDTTGDDDDTTGDDDDSTAPPPPAIYGVFEDAFSGLHAVTDHGWLSWGNDIARYDISTVDAAGQWLVARNSNTNTYNPGLWSRFEWTTAAAQLYMCQVAYDAANEEAALAAGPADATAPAASGCGGSFPWTAMSASATAIAVGGIHVDEWATDHQITDRRWVQTTAQDKSSFVISQHNNVAGFAIAQNANNNAFNPGLWSRFDWTWSGDDLFMCQTAYAAATEQDALATTAADATAPASSGCGGSFPWTNLTP